MPRFPPAGGGAEHIARLTPITAIELRHHRCTEPRRTRMPSNEEEVCLAGAAQMSRRARGPRLKALATRRKFGQVGIVFSASGPVCPIRDRTSESRLPVGGPERRPGCVPRSVISACVAGASSSRRASAEERVRYRAMTTIQAWSSHATSRARECSCERHAAQSYQITGNEKEFTFSDRPS